MKRFAALALIVMASCAKEESVTPTTTRPVAEPVATTSSAAPQLTPEEEVRAWQKSRDERLRREDSWLTLVGLFWLQEGENAIGSDKVKNRVVLPAKTPPSAGTLVVKQGKVTLNPTAAMTIGDKPVTGPIELQDDSSGSGPTFVKLGTVQFQIIKRGERLGVRVKDPESEVRTKFAGLEYYPIDPKWRVEARLEPYNPMKKIPIQDVTGMTSNSDSPGALVFTVEGKEYRLDPILEEGSDEYFIIFRDQTSRDETYPAGRYLYAKQADASGKTIVDFNKAYNPPCAFTDFATCPLPPLQNRLPIRVEAGEKKYTGFGAH
ncbi:MAG TPA: DUF1684 domain-containing protein [Thermoanaerobaculia bacterium]|jgi:hypothetical protein